MTFLTSLFFAGMLAAPQQPPAPAASASKPKAPCARPIHRQFDFWVGQWVVLNAEGKFVGTNRIERVGDCFLQENWAAAGGGYTGRSLNAVGFDGKWRQTWTDTSGLRLELTGGLVDGKDGSWSEFGRSKLKRQ